MYVCPTVIVTNRTVTGVFRNVKYCKDGFMYLPLKYICVNVLKMKCTDYQRDAQFLINNFHSTLSSCSTCFERN